MWYNSILETVGNTPLVRLNTLFSDFPCTVLAKVEFFNPGGSVKDRIGIAMIEAAERDGRLKPGGTIVEGTSGNTGTGLALAAITKGYKCIFTTTDKQSPEKADVLRALGAEVLICPTNVAPEDPRSYYSVSRRLAEETPNSVYLNQYDNPANAKAHYETSGPEIWRQTEGRVTHYIASAGTGGTISGTSKYLKEQNPDIKVVGVDTFGSVYHKYFHTREFDHAEIYPYLTEGAGEDILALNMDFDLVDFYVRSTDKENMIMTRRLARQEGLFVGQTSGMAVSGARKWLKDNAKTLKPEDVVVILLPDTGFRYLSKTYNDTWMRSHGFLDEKHELCAADVVTPAHLNSDIVSVAPGDTLQTAIDRMVQKGISQLPVIDHGSVIGSITESVVLNRLIEDPQARGHVVSETMGPPFPIVDMDTPFGGLTSLMKEAPGAVLVKTESGSFSIITKSDLIEALAGKKESKY
ncbi:MAG: pyridoxal-phosphate dependent enzyme [Bacteroidetes bacterium]|nr:pyridoxal-phosphate dependent enzyme [Bacteroidota bacterium]